MGDAPSPFRKAPAAPPALVAGLTAVAVFAWAHTALPEPLAGQAVVKGRVVAAQTQAPLGQAEVILDNLGRLVRTDNAGVFRLADIPLGVHQLRVRRIGFVAALASLRAEAADSVILELSLEAWVPELEPLFVTATRRRSTQMKEFDERRRIGLGRYLTPEDLRDNEHRTLADLVRERGIDVIYEPKGNQAFAIGVASPTFQSPSTRCTMRVLLNGVDLSVQGNDLNQYPVSMLGAVEIYRRPIQAPIQYTPTGSTCGLILLWSRSD